MSASELEKAVTRLSQKELSRFSEWFWNYHHDQWDKEIEEDYKSGKLDRLIQEAKDDYRKGQYKKL